MSDGMSTKEPAAADAPSPDLDDDRKGALKNIGGSKSDIWNALLARQAAEALWLKNSDPETKDKQLIATIAALTGIGPKDELEGMLAAQLIAAHNCAMECYRRSMIGEQTLEGRTENLSQANKLSRTFAALIEALNRHRGKGHQKVTVEHVHVYSGGQAVVGVVGGDGGGGKRKSEKQSHAKHIANAHEQALLGPDAERDVLPIARDAEW